jgi:hypothetical protein
VILSEPEDDVLNVTVNVIDMYGVARTINAKIVKSTSTTIVEVS